MRSTAMLGCLALAVSAWSQTAPSFDAASIKAAEPLTGPLRPGTRVGCGGGPGTSDPGTWHCKFASLADLVQEAYGLQRFQFAAAEWMVTTRFDIMAKVPAGTTKEQFRLMQQALLAERFKLAVHHEQKELPLYDLMIGKGGPKLKETTAESAVEEGESGTVPQLKMGADMFPVFPAGVAVLSD